MFKRTQIKTTGKPLSHIRFYSHSLLFYYWPMWMISITLGLLHLTSPASFESTYGSIFLLSLLFTLFSTSVDVRGLWVVLFSLSIVILGLLMHMANILDAVISSLFNLDIAINSDFYFSFGLPLFLIWLFVTFVYDRRHFVELRSHELTIVKEIGEGVVSFDTTGMVFKKQRDNFVQHMLFGMGSGDLIITAGVSGHKETIHVDNVLGIAKKIKMMHEIMEHRRT